MFHNHRSQDIVLIVFFSDKSKADGMDKEEYYNPLNSNVYTASNSAPFASSTPLVKRK